MADGNETQRETAVPAGAPATGGNGCLPTPPVALWCRQRLMPPHAVTLSVPGPTTTSSATPNTTPSTTVAAPTSALNGPRPDFPATAPAANPVVYRT